MKAKTETRTLKRRVAGREYSTSIEAVHEAEVDKWVFTDAALAAAELAIAARVASEAPPSGEAFGWMRRALDMKASELARLLGVRPETISRWETGAVDVDRGAWLHLGGLVLEQLGKPMDLRARMERIAAS